MRFPRRRSTPRLNTPGLLACCAAAVLTAAALLLSAPGARAATLQLAGPAGASVSLNGRAIGFLPLAEPLTVPAGTWELLCEMPGCIPHRQTIVLVTDDDWLHVTALLVPYSRSTAVWSNVVLAGMGPRYLGHSTRGWFYSIVEMGGLLTALGAEITRSNASDEYLLAMDAYAQEVDADQIAVRREEAEDKQQEASDAADLRDLGLMTAAGAIVVSMLDSWLSFGAVTAGAGDLPSAGGDGQAAGPSASPSFHSALRLEF
jgi:hypothetical protein